jgi:hypothetical protein
MGFMGFYSTVPSSGLATKLNARDLRFEIQIFDHERIEKQLLTPSGLNIAKRFFPRSFDTWQQEHPAPAKIFHEEPALSCIYCSKSLLHPDPHGIVVVWKSAEPAGHDHTAHVYWCCKGQCDRSLRMHFRRPGIYDAWEDIPDLIVPIAYIRWVTVMFNQLQNGKKFSDDAFENMKTLILNLFPLVARHMSAQEKDRISHLSAIPHYLGGWGYDD